MPSSHITASAPSSAREAWAGIPGDRHPLNREVALKVISAPFAAGPERLARFARESKLLASLNHPNIAAIYGIEENAIILELVEGHTRRLIGKGPFRSTRH